MSLINVIENFKTPIGYGMDRKAFYSKKYDVVVKRPKDDYNDEQTINEVAVWNKMSPVERTTMPIKEVITYKGILHIVMERCLVLSEVMPDDDFDASYSGMLESVISNLDLDDSNLDALYQVIDRYEMCDLHDGNMGITPDNRLVILDAGFAYSGGSDWSE